MFMKKMDKEESILKSPLSAIKRLYDENPSVLKKLDEIEKHFRVALEKDISKIPCINDTSIDNVEPNTLVRYRGMVQDMFDPEFYLGRYITTNAHTKEITTHIGCYTDANSHKECEEIDLNDTNNVTLERQTFYCVPVPGENKWIKDINSKNSSSINVLKDRATLNNKRIHEGNNEDIHMDDDTELSFEGNEKKQKMENSIITDNAVAEKDVNKVDFCKNFPLPDEKGRACLIKMYSNCDIKLNEVAEFICILSMDNNKNKDEMVMWHDPTSMEEQAHCPPPSLVPRLHCVFYNRLKHLNPHAYMKDIVYENTAKELSSVRADLIQLLTQIFAGDNTVAEYFLLYLISSVYGRCGAMCIGKLSLNITKCPNGNFTQQLYNLIQQLVEKSFYLQMSLENLNNMKFIPKKNYDANRLESGLLQLADDTHLILDETCMQSGQLNAEGVRNLTALGNVIQWQKVEYNFNFSKVEMNTNLNVLVLSEGKSLLKCDCQVPIVLEEAIASNHVDKLVSGIAPKLFEKMRVYLSIVKSVEYNLTDEIQKALEDDFVEMRKEDSKNVNADSFYLLLTTSRYMAVSYGQSTLSSSLWTRTKELDMERRKRVSS